MGGKLVYLPSVEWAEVCPAHGAPAGARLAAIPVADDSQAALGIYRGDCVIADLSLGPGAGQYAAVETPRGFWLGYATRLGGIIRLEPVCRCAECSLQEFPSAAVLGCGRVVGVCASSGCRSINLVKARASSRLLT